LKNTTPEEDSTRVKPEIEHFRIFGCPVYLHVPKEKKSKLDPLERKNIVNLQQTFQIDIPIQTQIKRNKKCCP
jgi:hypothetical protein